MTTMALSLAVSPIVQAYRLLLQPVAPFTWFGQQINTLDLAAALRLCVVVRQIREALYAAHVAKVGSAAASSKVEQRSLLRDVGTTLTVVYAGEAITAPWLGLQPSFMISGVVPALYIGAQTFVEWLPNVPTPAISNELPLALFDGLVRAYLLCNLIPPAVTKNASDAVALSPWTLLITALITPNAGFFITNLFSLLQPFSLTVQTPNELLPYGWTQTDLWCAPLITGIYAFLTHAQPFWADAHGVVSGILGTPEKEVQPVDSETARAFCALILAGMFTTRVAKNFGLLGGGGVGKGPKKEKKGGVKEKTQ